MTIKLHDAIIFHANAWGQRPQHCFKNQQPTIPHTYRIILLVPTGIIASTTGKGLVERPCFPVLASGFSGDLPYQMIKTTYAAPRTQ